MIQKIVTGDCLEVMKKIPDNYIHLIITSPPYNLNLNYAEYEDNLSHDEYISRLTNVREECKRILVSGWKLIINIAPTGIKDFNPLHVDMVNICRWLGFFFRAEILWYKQTIRNRTARWSWMSPSNPHVLPSREYVLVFQKDQALLPWDKSKIDITADEFKKWSDAHRYIPPETIRKGHPAPFPEELIYRLIKLYSYQENIILDPFWWTGTVAFVAKKLNRQFIHIDITEQYNEVAKQRLDKIINNMFIQEKITTQ